MGDQTERVRCRAHTSRRGPVHGGCHEVLVFEALHDMARPVEALAAARALLADGGCVIVGDERVAETFNALGDEVERLM